MYEGLKLTAAFALGAAAGIFGTKEFFRTKYEEIANEEIESVKKSISFRSGHILEENSIEQPEKFAEQLVMESQNEVPVLYSSLDDAKLEPIKEVAERIMESEHPEEDRSSDIYQITEDDFSETELGFDKLTLHYYIDDDMLVNADDGDWTATDLGDKIQDIRESNAPYLYFRSDSDATDYEVARIKGAYYIDM